MLTADKLAKTGKRLTTMRGELLPLLDFVDDSAVRRHCRVCTGSQEAVGKLWMRVTNVFKKEVMRIQRGVDRAVYNTVCDVATRNQGVAQETRSRISEAVVIASPVVDAGR